MRIKAPFIGKQDGNGRIQIFARRGTAVVDGRIMGCFVRVLLLCVLCALCGASSFAQCTSSPHCVTLTWTASADAAANPTLTYNVYRNGVCPTTPPATVAAALAAGFQKISTSPVTGLTYTDNGFPFTPIPPGIFCYFVTSTLNSAESVPSNLIQAVVLPAPPTNLAGAIK
jgi:hypothetical protein